MLYKGDRLTEDDLRVGMRLTYQGDTIPFVDAKHLIAKGNKNGLFLLPAWREEPAKASGKEWMDIPGSREDIYTIMEIVSGRFDKYGKPLPSLVHIKSSGYDEAWTFALRPLDACAKFLFHSIIDDIDGVMAIGVLVDPLSENPHTDRLRWENDMKEVGW